MLAWQCKVCGVHFPKFDDDTGLAWVEHGRGCYTQSEDGGGLEVVRREDCYEVCERHMEPDCKECYHD